MSTSVGTLDELTMLFFGCHWNKDVINEVLPKWSEPWRYVGPMPNHNRQGVYAFIKNGEVKYIGSGIGRGTKGYEGHGLGSRISNYVRVAEGNRYVVVDPRFSDADYVVTIGFPQGYGHVAIALEYFLLARMPTEHNQNRPGS